MRVLGVDPGSKRVGLALSDEEGRIALPHSVVERKGSGAAAKVVSEVAKVARDAGVTRIVVGLPLRLDGTEGPEAKRARGFGEAVSEAAGVAVVFVDERLTTALASRALDAGRVKAAKRREVVDQAAATVLLQGYLDSMGGGEWDADEPDDAP